MHRVHLLETPLHSKARSFIGVDHRVAAAAAGGCLDPEGIGEEEVAATLFMAGMDGLAPPHHVRRCQGVLMGTSDAAC